MVKTISNYVSDLLFCDFYWILIDNVSVFIVDSDVTLWFDLNF